MKKSLLFLVTAVLMLCMASCINDGPDFSTEVIRVEYHTSYYKGDDHWRCREALIYVDHQSKYVMFPKQYEEDIVVGTKILYECSLVTAYYKDGKKIAIDWDGTKVDD